MEERGSQLDMGRSRYSAQRGQSVHAENRRRAAQRRKGKGKGPIRVSKKPVNSGAVSVRNVSVRERFMRFLLGDKVRLTVIVPGSSVEELSIREIAEGGLAHE